MDSDLQQQQPPQMNPPSGLTRYRSAPSSYFSDIIDREFYEHIFSKPSSPETERVFSRFMNSFSGGGGGGVDGGVAAAAEEDDHHPVSAPVKREIDQDHHNEHVVLQQQSSEIVNDYNNSAPPPQSFYQKPPLPNQNLQSGGGGGNNSNLIRHSSSPAGLFSQINIENGYGGVRGMGTLGAVNNSLEGAKFSSARRLKNPQSYSSVAMSTIAEIGDKGSRENNSDSEAFSERIGNDFITGFPVGAWDDSAMMSDNVSGLKRFRDDDTKPFSGLSAAETQNEAGGQSSSHLVHQMSMPNTSSEMAAIEKFLHFSDSVPCKIRAKRGFATHPRSIAERVRRTKISERMRKLQDLVPNMDKQTNTADMLDLAVDYIKDLQNQVQEQLEAVDRRSQHIVIGPKCGVRILLSEGHVTDDVRYVTLNVR